MLSFNLQVYLAVDRFWLAASLNDGMRDGMSIMTHRTTFALDRTTALRLKRLASRWKVSQAEVVRRSVEQAEKQSDLVKPDAVALLKQLHEEEGGLDPKQAEAYLAQIYTDRKHWRGSK